MAPAAKEPDGEPTVSVTIQLPRKHALVIRSIAAAPKNVLDSNPMLVSSAWYAVFGAVKAMSDEALDGALTPAAAPPAAGLPAAGSPAAEPEAALAWNTYLQQGKLPSSDMNVTNSEQPLAVRVEVDVCKDRYKAELTAENLRYASFSVQRTTTIKSLLEATATRLDRCVGMRVDGKFWSTSKVGSFPYVAAIPASYTLESLGINSRTEFVRMVGTPLLAPEIKNELMFPTRLVQKRPIYIEVWELNEGTGKLVSTPLQRFMVDASTTLGSFAKIAAARVECHPDNTILCYNDRILRSWMSNFKATVPDNTTLRSIGVIGAEEHMHVVCRAPPAPQDALGYSIEVVDTKNDRYGHWTVFPWTTVMDLALSLEKVWHIDMRTRGLYFQESANLLRSEPNATLHSSGITEGEMSLLLRPYLFPKLRFSVPEGTTKKEMVAHEYHRLRPCWYPQCRLCLRKAPSGNEALVSTKPLSVEQVTDQESTAKPLLPALASLVGRKRKLLFEDVDTSQSTTGRCSLWHGVGGTMWGPFESQ